MAKIGVTEASRRFDKSRTTIYKYIHNNQLSTSEDHEGNTVIDVAELVRVFGEPGADEQTDESVNSRVQSTERDIDMLKQAFEVFSEQLKAKDEQIRRQDETIERLIKALPAPEIVVTPPPAPSTPEAEKKPEEPIIEAKEEPTKEEPAPSPEDIKKHLEDEIAKKYEEKLAAKEAELKMKAKVREREFKREYEERKNEEGNLTRKTLKFFGLIPEEKR